MMNDRKDAPAAVARTIAAVAIAAMTSACASAALAKTVARDTANAVSLDPSSANLFRSFAPELGLKVERITGVHGRVATAEEFTGWTTEAVTRPLT